MGEERREEDEEGDEAALVELSLDPWERVVNALVPSYSKRLELRDKVPYERHYISLLSTSLGLAGIRFAKKMSTIKRMRFAGMTEGQLLRLERSGIRWLASMHSAGRYALGAYVVGLTLSVMVAITAYRNKFSLLHFAPGGGLVAVGGVMNVARVNPAFSSLPLARRLIVTLGYGVFGAATLPICVAPFALSYYMLRGESLNMLYYRKRHEYLVSQLKSAPI